MIKQICSLTLLLVLLGCSNSPSPTSSTLPVAGSSWWQVSSSHRYLANQAGTPVLLVGDSPHSMFVNLNTSDLTTYLSNRESQGINVLWVEGLCSDYISNCRNDLSTYDGIKPFNSGTDEGNFDVSSPNETYWSRVDTIVNAAAAHGISILFDTWETGALMPLARANGDSKMRSFGAFLGNRYKNVPNILWITGNDFQTWTDPGDNDLMQNLMAGIASADATHLQTTELNYLASGSLDDLLLVPYTKLAGAYDYYCSYGQTLAQYNNPSPMPVFFEEGFYEYRGTTRNLRTQAWWAALSGATAGQLYGSENIYPFAPDWKNFLNTTGIAEFGYLNTLLKSMKWYDLVPDQSHMTVIGGYGTPDNSDANSDCINTNDYVSTAYLADGTLSLSYAPIGTTLTVDLSKFNGPVSAKWFDPSSGNSIDIPGSPFSNSGIQSLSTPGSNAAGDPDWALLLKNP